MRAAEGRDVHVLCFRQRLGCLARADAQERRSQLGKGAQARLPIGFVPLQHQLKVGSQRGRVEGAYKHRLGRRFGVGHDVVGALTHEGKQAALQQSRFHLLRAQAVHALCAVRHRLVFAVGRDDDAHHLPALAAVHRCYHAGDRTHKFQRGMPLVNKQGIARLDLIACGNHHLRRDAREVVWHERIARCLRQHDAFRRRGSPLQLDVKAFS